MNIHIPVEVNYILNTLMKHGHQAYIVGGCVRDVILGKEPEDWDVTTSATPYQVKKLFPRTIDTGIVHGTVTVMIDKSGYEVTTYRIDGEYEDNRHPKTVNFTPNLSEDLARRDFTMNAMAYNHRDGLVDLHHGYEDLQQGVIRCVGNPYERFDEDALRILRGVRFSAQLGFDIHEETRQAIEEKASNLCNISAERIRVELDKLITSSHPDRLVMAYELGITKVILPEWDTMMATEQNNPHHIYSVGIHTLKAMEVIESTSLLRWTMLLHDVAKPITKTTSSDGIDHFIEHQEEGVYEAKNILRRLKFDNDTIHTVIHLVKWHDENLATTPAGMRRQANRIGIDIMPLLFQVKRADISAQNPDMIPDKLEKIEKGESLYQDILNKKQCVDLNMLQINGKDLIGIGYKPGIQLGKTLKILLEEVLEDPNLNNRDILIERARKFI